MGQNIINHSQLKQLNRYRIFHKLLFKKMTIMQLSADLNLSQPTVGQVVNDFLESGYVEQIGFAKSAGGRRAAYYQVISNCRVSIGIEISANHTEIVLIDLQGNVLSSERRKISYSQETEYQEEIQQFFYSFLIKYKVNTEKLLGIGISLPGIVDDHQDTIRNSYSLNIQYKTLPANDNDLFSVRYINDANAICLAENFIDSSIENFTIVSLNNTIGGASFFNNKFVYGLHDSNSEFGHLCLVPNGRTCHCGQKGHFDAYCSALVLSNETNGDLYDFFQQLEEGNSHLQQVFNEYLDYLALFLYNLQTYSDHLIILSGYVSEFLEPYIPILHEKVQEMNPFKTNEPSIRLSHYRRNASVIGAALFFVRDFLRHV